MRRDSVPVSQAPVPQPDWWRAMPFEHTIWESVQRGTEEVCIDVYVILHICLCACMHVKGERWLALAVKGKKVWLFVGGLILPLPASTDL